MLDLRVTGRAGTLSLDVTLRTNGAPLVVIGPNGSGKTTLLLHVLGEREPTGGRIVLNERVLYDPAESTALAPQERGVGYLPQSYALFPQMTALDNVAFGIPRNGAGTKRRDRRERARSLLADLAVEHLAGRRPAALSGGEKQRVALARALAPEPSALLLDEPLAALDTTVRRKTRDFLARYLERAALPAVVVTHDPQDVRALAGHVLVLEEGKVVQEGSVEELTRKPATAFVRDFFEP